MLSRIADSLFWLNRYIERSDSILRLVYVHYILSLDRTAGESRNWRPVLELCTTTPEPELERMENNTAAALHQVLFANNNTNSICNLIGKARENARGAQDHITKEVWEVVNQLYHLANDRTLAGELENGQALKVIDGFSRSTVMFTGITDNTMWRGIGWNFMQMGKYFERCFQSIAIVEKQLLAFENTKNTNDILQWRNLLFSLSGYEMHLKNYRSAQPEINVLQQVLLDENFTRSIMYSLIRVNYYNQNVMQLHDDNNKDLERNFGRTLSHVKYADIQTMDKKAILAFLADVRQELVQLSNQVAHYYFSYT